VAKLICLHDIASPFLYILVIFTDLMTMCLSHMDTLLLQLINEKPSVINEYESGKAIPNPQVLQKLSRALGVTLKKT
jgi:hypothetical protein